MFEGWRICKLVLSLLHLGKWMVSNIVFVDGNFVSCGLRAVGLEGIAGGKHALPPSPP